MKPSHEPSRETGIPDLPVIERTVSNRAEMGISKLSLPDVATARQNFDRALAFLKEVKNRFKEDKDKYDQFLKLMKDFQRNCSSEVIARVKDFFRGHWALIAGFNAFLPEGQQITLLNKQSVEYIRLVNYADKFRMRFQRDEPVYKSFLEILTMYQKGHKSITEVHQEVAHLLKAQHAGDLLDEFVDLSGYIFAIPVEWLEIPVEISTKLAEETKRVAKDYTRRKERVGDGAQDDGMPSSNLEKDERKEINPDPGVKTKAGKFQVGQSSVQQVEIFPELLVDMKEIAKHYSRRKEKIGDWAHDNGMPSSNLKRDEWKRIKKKKESSELEERDKAMKAGDKEKEKDLADSQRKLHPKRKSEQIWKQRQAEEKDLADSQRRLHPRRKSKRIWKQRQAQKEKDLADLQRRLHSKRMSERIWKRQAEKQNESSPEPLCTSITELAESDQSSWERCTPSYRRLPSSYKTPLSTHRTDSTQTVINDNWISVKSISGDFSVEENSVFEKILFRFEDKQYESDMGIERMATTVQSVDALIEYIKLRKKVLTTKFKRPLSNKFVLDQHLNATHLSCIEMIYRDDGLEFMDSLRENPEKVLPEVLIRLKQKHHELSRSQSTKAKKRWAEVRSKTGLG